MIKNIDYSSIVSPNLNPVELLPMFFDMLVDSGYEVEQKSKTRYSISLSHASQNLATLNIVSGKNLNFRFHTGNLKKLQKSFREIIMENDSELPEFAFGLLTLLGDSILKERNKYTKNLTKINLN